MIVFPLIQKIAELFLILFAAAALVRLKLLRSEDSRVLSQVSLNFVTPCVIFNSFRKDLTAEVLQGLAVTILLGIAFHILFMIIARILGHVWKATEVERASIIFTNAGNLIIPIVAYVLGQEWVIYVSGYVVVFNIICWTYGVRLFDNEGPLEIRRILLNPNLLAVGAGLLFLLLRIPLPGPIGIAFDDIASMIGPFSMIITGMIVGSMQFSDIFGNRRIFLVVFFRMILCSGAAVGLALLTGIAHRIPSGEQIVMISLLSAIAPTGNNINLLAILYNKDAKYATAINVLTTLSCIATIPLWVMLYQRLVGMV